MILVPALILGCLVAGIAIVPPSILMWGNRFRERMLTRTGRRLRPVSRRTYSQWFAGYAFLSVAFGWSALFLFYPLVKSLYYSLTDKSLSVSAATEFVGLENYAALVQDPLWWKSILVTVIYIAGAVPYSVFVSLFLASLIVNMPTRWQNFFKAALYLPGVVGLVVQAAIMKWIFYPGDGFANLLLTRLGILDENLVWFSDPHLALPTIIAMTWLSTNGIGVIIYCAALGGIPRDYYEAAEIDGASRMQKFFHITWPLVKPSTVFVSITGLIGGFQVFAPAMLITGGGPQYTTNFVNYRIYQTFYFDNQFGLACAMSVLLMFVIVAVSVVNYRLLASDVEY